MSIEDPEINAMSTVSAALTGLDQETQARVLAWAASRYGLKPSAAPLGASGEAGEKESDPKTNGSTGSKSPRKSFNDFVDLYDASSPSSGPERALVAGYWFQVVHANPTFSGQQANDVLKNIGYGVANITSALTSLQDRKPALVRQTNKSGKSVQARKTYKLTEEGIRNVRRMLGEASE
jgi:hypothetical protein